MPPRVIKIGIRPNDDTGDPPRVAWDKQNKNNVDLFQAASEAVQAASEAARQAADVSGSRLSTIQTEFNAAFSALLTGWFLSLPELPADDADLPAGGGVFRNGLGFLVVPPKT